MENRATILGVNRKVVIFVNKVMLFAILFNSIVVPSQSLIMDTFFYKAPFYYHDNGASLKKADNPVSSLLYPNSASNKASQKNGGVIPTNLLNKKNDLNYTLDSDIKEGVIGVSNTSPLDDASDNLFKFYIKDLPKENVKVFLTYELYGVQDCNAVSRSINDRPATGGYIVKNQMGWTSQKEEVNVNWLHTGENKVMFGIPNGANYQYQIKDLKLEFDIKDNVGIASSLVVTTSNVIYIKDNQLYVKGFVRNNNKEVKVFIEDAPLTVTDGEYEGFLQLTDALKSRKFVMVKAFDSTGLLGQEIVMLDNLTEADHLYDLEKNEGIVSEMIKAHSKRTLKTQGASVSINDSSLTEDKEISISKLRNVDIAPLSSGLVNVTKGGYGYRFLPDGTKFAKPVTLSIEYDEKLIPKGHSANEIKTFYFDTKNKTWVAINRDTINKVDKTIVSLTNHFTDYINGIIQTPESPETAGFTSTMMNDIKAVDPSSEMTLISPPEVSQKGDANVSYPIKIPAGRKGMQPQIAIQYSNEGGNGWLGQGWNINTPSISIDTKWGVPTFNPDNESEIYMLNGEQLMYPKIGPVSNMVDWMPNRHYDVSTGTSVLYNTTPRPRITDAVFTPRKQGNFSKIERLGNSPTEYHWKVTNADGTINWYGGKDDVIENAVIRDANKNIVHWGIYLTQDVYGNSIAYKYTNTKLLGFSGINENLNHSIVFNINDIQYNGYQNNDYKYEIIFKTDPTIRTDIAINARLGVKQAEPYLLKAIYVQKTTSEMIRQYSLSYHPGEFGKDLLVKASELDKDGNLFYEHTFDYYNDLGVEKKVMFDSPVTIQVPSFNADFTLGLGNTPLMNTSRLNTNENIETSWDVRPALGIQLPFFDNNPGHLFTVGFPFGESYPKSKGKITMSDMNGDGLDDILYKDPDGTLKYFPHMINSNGDHIFDTNNRTIVNINNYNRTSGKTKTMFGESFDFQFLSFSCGQKRFKSKDETNIYLTDGNGDGLPDIVNENKVYFNTGLNSSGQNVFETGSESTPNMVITADPTPLDPATVLDLDPETTKMNYDVVRVWEAPITGSIKMQDAIQFIPENSDSKVIYSIETLNPKYNNGIPYRVYLKEFNSSNLADNLNIENFNPSIPLGCGGILQVVKGQKIYFRIHKNETGNNDVLNTNPTITYLSSSYPDDLNGTGNYSNSNQLTNPTLDQNGKNILSYNYNDDFILSGDESFNVPSSGSIIINWNPITITGQSDDLIFKIIREDQDINGASTQTVIQNWNCPMGNTNTLISSTSIPSSITIGAIPTDHSVIFKFLVTSRSNVKWNEINWKPIIKYIPDASASNLGVLTATKNIVPKYSIFQTQGDNLFKLDSTFLNTNSNTSNLYYWNLPIASNNAIYSVIPNIIIPSSYPSSLALVSTDVGNFSFVVKKNGVVIGRKEITINGSTITIDNSNPIPFHTGVVDNASPTLLSTEFYIDGSENLRIFNKYSELVSYNIDPHLGGNIIVGYNNGASDNEWNFPTTDLTHYWRYKGFPNDNSNEHLGAMYRNWGQFLYNDSLDSDTSIPHDNYSKLVNNHIVESEMNNSVNTLITGLGINTTACSSSSDPTACVIGQINNTLQIPTTITTGNVQSVVQTLLTNVALSGVSYAPCLISMHPFRKYTVSNEEIEKWIGSQNNQYSKAMAMRDGDMDDSAFGAVFNNPNDIDSVGMIGNQDTGMIAINKTQNNVSMSYFAGWGSTNFSSSNSHYSNTDSDFIDVNGDRYPDVLLSDNIQTTTMTGGHRTPYGTYGLNPLNSNDSSNQSISTQKRCPIAGRESVKDDPQGGNGQQDSGNPSYHLGLGLTANLSGNNKEREAILDLNGDGLPDRLKYDGAGNFSCQMNLGRSFTNSYENFSLYDSTSTIPNSLSTSISLNGSFFNSSNFPCSLSLGYSASGGNSDISLQDINGDGLLDLLNFTGSSGTVKYNLGNSFSSVAMPLTTAINLFNNSTSTSVSLAGDISYFHGFPIFCFFGLCI